ncbi:MAG: hypothetical protein GY699_06320, partial [Desulfobacteraceae bacterium]|nr:hypothetical protein [Desulfobacteraceae bacterium]
MKTLVIGDIHGCYDELMALLDKAALGREDRIIALGDILDRGPDSAKVVDFFNLHAQASCLMGNHEHKHLLMNEGTIQPSISQQITSKHFSESEYRYLIHAIRQFPYCLDMETAVLVHGSFEPGISVAQQKQAVLLGTRNGEAYLKKTYDKPWYMLYDQKKPIIAGHRDVSGKGEVQVINDTVFFMDTGCCYGKTLSAVLLPDFKIFQVKSRKNYWGIIKQQALNDTTRADVSFMNRKTTLERILKKKDIIREDEPCDLYEALGDVEPHIRKAAADALAQTGDTCWQNLVKGDDVDIIRLGGSDLLQAIPALIYAMGWREIMFRTTTITQLGHIAVFGVVDQLARALNHVNCRIRKGAAEALGYRLEPQAATVLIYALDHVDPDVVTHAADSLRAFDDPRIIPA